MTDFIPVLSDGPHHSPEDGACVMEMVSFMAGEEWSDTPKCADRMISMIAQSVNDFVEDHNRHLILKDFDRLFGTALSDMKQAVVLRNELQKMFNQSPSTYVIDLWGMKMQAKRDMDPNWDKFDYEILNVLTRALDIFDELTGRESVPKQDLQKLQELIPNAS